MTHETVSHGQVHLSNKTTPGPRGSPIVGALPQFRKAPHRFFVDLNREYGGIARFKLAFVTFYLLSDPDGIKHVMQDNYRNYHKGYKAVSDLLGNGLIMSEGDLWRSQRRLMQPAFHREQLASLASMMTDLTMNQVDRWRLLAKQDEPIDVLREMVGLTQNIILKTMFSTNSSDDIKTIGEDLDAMMDYLFKRLFAAFSLPASLPLPANIRFRSAKQRLGQLIYRIIEERRASPIDNADLLSLLIHARDEESGAGMSDQQLHDELITIYLAGHETTAMTMTWLFLLLAQHPHVEQKLREEYASVLGGRTPTLNDLPQLTYTRMVLDETMRMYPPAWMVMRQAIADDEVCGYTVSKGETIVISPYAVHRDATYWENPDQFDPERFTPERKNHLRFAYIPFGAGPRKCIGDQFGLMEAQLILPMLLQSFHLDLLPGQYTEPIPKATLRPPASGIKMMLSEHIPVSA